VGLGTLHDGTSFLSSLTDTAGPICMSRCKKCDDEEAVTIGVYGAVWPFCAVISGSSTKVVDWGMLPFEGVGRPILCPGTGEIGEWE
jgi:hypothetical protein